MTDSDIVHSVIQQYIDNGYAVRTDISNLCAKIFTYLHDRLPYGTDLMLSYSHAIDLINLYGLSAFDYYC